MTCERFYHLRQVITLVKKDKKVQDYFLDEVNRQDNPDYYRKVSSDGTWGVPDLCHAQLLPSGPGWSRNLSWIGSGC